MLEMQIKFVPVCDKCKTPFPVLTDINPKQAFSKMKEIGWKKEGSMDVCIGCQRTSILGALSSRW